MSEREWALQTMFSGENITVLDSYSLRKSSGGLCLYAFHTAFILSTFIDTGVLSMQNQANTCILVLWVFECSGTYSVCTMCAVCVGQI